MVEQKNMAADFATVIGPDAQFKGELTFEGGVRIDGRFEGSITTKGKVLISKGGEVKAEIKATSLVLEGRLVGNIEADDIVELRATGQLEGDVKASKLLVVEGATLVGRCEVGAGAKRATAGQPRKNGDAQPEMRPVGAAVK